MRHHRRLWGSLSVSLVGVGLLYRDEQVSKSTSGRCLLGRSQKPPPASPLAGSSRLGGPNDDSPHGAWARLNAGQYPLATSFLFSMVGLRLWMAFRDRSPAVDFAEGP
jgi:hypothetical protein